MLPYSAQQLKLWLSNATYVKGYPRAMAIKLKHDSWVLRVDGELLNDLPNEVTYWIESLVESAELMPGKTILEHDVTGQRFTYRGEPIIPEPDYYN